MADDSTDVLMTFTGGTKFEAECQATWAQEDTMKSDFSAGAFFQIEDFSLSGGLETEESSEEKSRNGSESSSGGNQLRGNGGKDGRDGGLKKSKKAYRGNKFANYILEGSLRYPIDLQEISISRQFDKASPIFLQSCLKLVPFTKAVIVKRKVVGGVTETSSVRHLGFLRMEFTKPLITSIDWEDGDIVREKLKFVCRGLMIAYRPQKPDGSLGDPVSMSWDPSRPLT